MNLKMKYDKYAPHLDDIVFYLKSKLSDAVAAKVMNIFYVLWIAPTLYMIGKLETRNLMMQHFYKSKSGRWKIIKQDICKHN